MDIEQLKPGTRITWRTMDGTRSGTIRRRNDETRLLLAMPDHEHSPAIVSYQDIIRVYS